MKKTAVGLHLCIGCSYSAMEVEKLQKFEVFTSFLLTLNVTNFCWAEVPICELKTTEGKSSCLWIIKQQWQKRIRETNEVHPSHWSESATDLLECLIIRQLCFFFRADELFDHSDIHMNASMYIYIIFLFLICERFFLITSYSFLQKQ